jgi:hypothetical protein
MQQVRVEGGFRRADVREWVVAPNAARRIG